MQDKISLDKVRNLPDIMEDQDVLLWMDKLLRDFPHPVNEQVHEVKMILYELTCRQVDTYKPLNEEMRKRITNYINSFINFSCDIVSFEYWVGIVGMLYLYELYPVLLARRNDKSLSENSRICLEEFKTDFVDKDDFVDENGFLIKK